MFKQTTTFLAVPGVTRNDMEIVGKQQQQEQVSGRTTCCPTRVIVDHSVFFSDANHLDEFQALRWRRAVKSL